MASFIRTFHGTAICIRSIMRIITAEHNYGNSVVRGYLVATVHLDKHQDGVVNTLPYLALEQI